MRFYDINSGSIRIGGRDIRTFEGGELHRKFGIAMQNDFLYSDTIEENIRFGRELSHEDIVRAAKIAQADEFISPPPTDIPAFSLPKRQIFRAGRSRGF